MAEVQDRRQQWEELNDLLTDNWLSLPPMVFTVKCAFCLVVCFYFFFWVSGWILLLASSAFFLSFCLSFFLPFFFSFFLLLSSSFFLLSYFLLPSFFFFFFIMVVVVVELMNCWRLTLDKQLTAHQPTVVKLRFVWKTPRHPIPCSARCLSCSQAVQFCLNPLPHLSFSLLHRQAGVSLWVPSPLPRERVLCASVWSARLVYTYSRELTST